MYHSVNMFVSAVSLNMEVYDSLLEPLLGIRGTDAFLGP